MPGWIISLILQMVLKFGIPMIIDWLKKRFPWLPIPEQMVPVLQDYIRDVQEAKVTKQMARRRAHTRLRECYGVACPTDLVKD